MYYETTVQIAASAEKVWSVLSDVERWPEWTTSVTEVRRNSPGNGELRPGDTVVIKQPKMSPLTWTVVDWEPKSSFSWTAKSPGVTTFADHRITQVGDDASPRVTVTLSLRQTGPLAPVIGLLMGRLTRSYVDTEAAGLKRRCEQG